MRRGFFDPGAQKCDAFSFKWEGLGGYAFPPLYRTSIKRYCFEVDKNGHGNL